MKPRRIFQERNLKGYATLRVGSEETTVASENWPASWSIPPSLPRKLPISTQDKKIEKFPEKGNQRLRYDTGEDGHYLGQGASLRQLGRFPGLLRQELKVLRGGRPCLLDHRSQRGGS